MTQRSTNRVTVLEVVILQEALARLVANRAVDRVIDEEGLFDLRAALGHLVAVGDEHGAVFGRRLTGRDDFGDHRDLAGRRILGAGLDQAHPATGDHRKPRVPAVMGHVDSGALGGLNAVEPLVVGHGNFDAVD